MRSSVWHRVRECTVCFALPLTACTIVASSSQQPSPNGGGDSATSAGASSGTGGEELVGSSAGAGGTSGTTSGSGGTRVPTGSLHTQGNHIYDENGNVWMGRGVNVDDLFLCGGNSSVDSAKFITVINAAMTWAPTMNFIRISLYMNSYGNLPETWSAASTYATEMTTAIKHIGTTYPGVYVLLTLRTDASMACYSDLGGSATAKVCAPDNCESDCVPTAGTSTTLKAIVDTFADSPFVIFAPANEPFASASVVRTAMSAAVTAIRAEEDALKVPHHLVSVQTAYAGNPGTVFATPLAADNVIYEIHYYPDLAGSSAADYAYADTLPAVIGEYGGFTTGAGAEDTFYAGVEAKQIPNLAWDYSPYSDCYPDLVGFAESATWGPSVQTYLAAHAADSH